MADTRAAISVTVQEAAKLTGLSRSTLYNLMGEGRLAYSKVDGRRLVMWDSLEALIRGGVQTENSATPVRDCDESDGDDHFMCGCIVLAARQVTKHVLGTNCTFADDDIKALGILADKAIRAGLHHEVEIPASLIAAIDKHLVGEV